MHETLIFITNFTTFVYTANAACMHATQVGKGVQAVVAITTASRLKKLQPQLQEVANSFRVYDGILVEKLTYATSD